MAIRRIDKLRRRIKERWTKECSFESLRWFVITVCAYNDTGKFPQTWRGGLIGVYNLITAIQGKSIRKCSPKRVALGRGIRGCGRSPGHVGIRGAGTHMGGEGTKSEGL